VADRLIRLVLTLACATAGVALVSMMLLTVLDFSLRFTRGSSIAGAFEMTELAMVAIVFLGLGHGQRRRRHITIDLLYDLAGTAGRRSIDHAARAIALLVAVLTGWQLWRYLLQVRADAQVSGVLGVPLHVVVTAALLGFGLYGVSLWSGAREDSRAA
jgi:TRAP-type C4-dicarboxylate transport system permease small subunit